jgi:peroxiredoxin
MQNRKEKLERAGIKVLAVLTEADEEKIDAIKRKYGLTFPIVPDPTGIIAKRYSIQMWPTLLSLDRKASVKNAILGANRNAIADFARFQTKESDSPRKI